MATRTKTPSFTVTLPLVVTPAADRSLLARFEAGRRLYNAVLGDALTTLRLMRESKQWQAARAMPMGKPDSLERKARNAVFSACTDDFGFTETHFDSVAIAHKNAAGFVDRLGTHDTQRIGERAFSAVQKYALGQRGRPRFKGKGRGLRSIESKINTTGIRWKPSVGCVEWKKLVLPVKLPPVSRDPYLDEALKSDTKYCRIIWRMVRGRRRWYVQLIQKGKAPAKYDFYAGGMAVGIDVGPSAVAIVGDAAVGLERFAPSVEQPWQEQRRIQRAMDRSRRAMNPDNYDDKGRAKPGRHVWKKSNRYRRLETRLADTERRLAAARKRDHGELANRIVGLGTTIKAEQLSYKAWQKRFGRSAKVRASGKFIERLARKAESAGGSFVELDTRRLRMSQYDHVTDAYTKKSLLQRWHRLGGGSTIVQRDCYSAFLAKHATGSVHNPAGLERVWTSVEPHLKRVGLCKGQSAKVLPKGSPTVAVPSERIAREKRLSHGSPPECCSRKTRVRNPLCVEAVGTPWL